MTVEGTRSIWRFFAQKNILSARGKRLCSPACALRLGADTGGHRAPLNAFELHKTQAPRRHKENIMPATLSIPDPMPAEGCRTYSPWRTLALFWVIGVLSISLSACQFGDDTMGLDLVGYNHTDRDIGSFYVNDVGGAFEAKHEGGGAVCCIAIPSKYTPGMTVTVKWTDDYDENPQFRSVAVPPYTPADGGMFVVHFLRNGKIKVFVTMLLPRHPDYPLKGEEAKL